ncbi:MAG: RNA pyrophosphohydrolase [Pseudomonadota bacterium]
MIDPDGFRPNVGIILSNSSGQLLWARRAGQDAWQFPQGGMRSDETPTEAMYRELGEEIGLTPGDVEVMGTTRGWLRYRLPRRYIRHASRPLCIGQKQVWFLLRILCTDRSVCLDRCARPEFDRWRWVDYWHPLSEVVAFKRKVYRQALKELAPLLFPEGIPDLPAGREN